MTNKLAQSTSPYLQQHADNPVHWQEWGPEALAESKKTGKPILLSIGYSACHWCHVMAHESFEDDAVAAIMNAHFINIKVDREERPDIDQIYQSAHAMLTQRSGGWPLTMFLTPDTAPFFGGTYFPKTARYGLPGFGDLLKRVSQYHAENQTEIRDQNEELVRALNRETFEPANGNGRESTSPQMDRKPIELGIERICDSFDQQDGGFGSAPKFPHPEMIENCLRQFAATGDADARHAACFTLQKMCEGGIYDQIGGGFARYSVDGEWAIPHFEKMLYDNGPLLRLLADASLVAENDAQRALFTRCAHETAAWVMREMQSPQGGYYSTLDADAEGHEGKFTVWTREAAQAVLDEEEWRVIEAHYGFDRAANFEHEAWNPVIAVSLDALDARFGFEPDTSARIVARAKQKLFAARETRIRPGRDEKILVSWNALMIEGMMRAALVFDQPQWAESARKALQFLRLAMWDAASQKLFATHKDGKSHLNAYLDDYAFLLKALITRLQTTFDASDLQWVTSLADALLTRFEDQKRGGFFFTSHDHEALIQRPKPGFDNATPSGNGVAAVALNRLTHITGDTRYADAAKRTLFHFWRAISQHPSGHGSFLMALSEWLEPPAVLVLTGPPEATAAWQRTLAAEYRPALLTFTPGPVSDLPQALVKPTVEAVNAYLCRGVSCLAPITALPELQAALKNSIVPPN